MTQIPQSDNTEMLQKVLRLVFPNVEPWFVAQSATSCLSLLEIVARQVGRDLRHTACIENVIFFMDPELLEALDAGSKEAKQSFLFFALAESYVSREMIGDGKVSENDNPVALAALILALSLIIRAKTSDVDFGLFIGIQGMAEPDSRFGPFTDLCFTFMKAVETAGITKEQALAACSPIHPVFWDGQL